MAFTINSVTMPAADNPDGITIERAPQGAERRMSDGSLRVQYIALKRRVQIRWSILTQTERNTCYTAYTTAQYTSTAVVLPTGDSFNAMTGMGSWSEALIARGDGTAFYDVSFALNEV